MKKRAVITLLGMIGIPREGQQQAKYSFSKKLDEFSKNMTDERYVNTLPLLIDVFDDRDIIPIATQKAKEFQIGTLESLDIKSSALDNTIIINESDYEEIFQEISKLLDDDKYDSVIVDLTHGFRHLPILMIVNLIIASMKDVDKIEHIFFAKEIVSFKEYKIIDLLDYIDLAKLSFVLENFNFNYTVGNQLIFKNEVYQDLVDNLRIISGHILANSLKTLIEKDNNLINQTIEKLNKLKEEDKNIATFSNSIENIIKHLRKIEILKDEEDYIKLFKFSEMMKKREYLLNSITLLNESIGLYCAKKISNISNDIKKHIDNYKINNNNLYELAHQSKNIIKTKSNFSGNYLFEPNKIKLTSGQKTSLQKKKKRLKEKISNDILQEIEEAGFKVELSRIDNIKDNSIKTKIINYLENKNNNELISLIIDSENLRNNLAHGNSSDEVKNVKGIISKLLREYQRIIKIPNEINIEEKIKEIEKKQENSKSIKKEKIIPTGIKAPKEQIDNLKNIFNNR